MSESADDDDFFNDGTGGSLLNHLTQLRERRDAREVVSREKRAAIEDERRAEEAQRKPTIRSAADYLEPLERLWTAGLPSGDKPGWPSVDALYTVAPGQMTILTGWPGAGKSEWLDAVLVNLARQGWAHAIFSAENQPVELHVAKLIEKISGMPFGDGPNPRVPQDALSEYCDELRAFRFISPRVDALSVPTILETALSYLNGAGEKRGLVIDPWNELEHWRPHGKSETEYVSETLSTVRNWARATGTHVWIVAHPAKQKREENGKLPVPRPDMISGSQHWWNKADACLCVYRSPEPDADGTLVDIHVQKIRFKHIGRPGMATLRYDRINGRYSDPEAKRMYLVAAQGEDE